MKINPTNPRPVATNKSSESARGSKSEGLKDSLFQNVKPGTTATEKVNLSDRAQSIRKAKQLATPDHSVNEARVEELQKLIDAGKYKVDAESVADQLVDEHLKF